MAKRLKISKKVREELTSHARKGHILGTVRNNLGDLLYYSCTCGTKIKLILG